MIHIKATLYHNTEIETATIGGVHNDLIHPTEDTHRDLTMTLHTSHLTDHPNIKALHIIDPKIAIDHIHDHPIDL